MFRGAMSRVPSVRMSLSDVKVTHTTFSMFVDYSYIMGGQ